MQALLDQALLILDEKEEKIGMFFLAESAKEKQNVGTAVSVGPGVTRRDGVFVPTQTQVGQRLYFRADRKVDVRENGRDYVLVQEKNIYGYLNEDNVIVPLFSYVLLQMDEQVDKIGSFIIADNAKEKSNTGTVISAGPGRKKDDGTYIPVLVKAGDRVLFNEDSTIAVKNAGKNYVLVAEENVLAVLEAE